MPIQWQITVPAVMPYFKAVFINCLFQAHAQGWYSANKCKKRFQPAAFISELQEKSAYYPYLHFN
jgi:hypothetical protein